MGKGCSLCPPRLSCPWTQSGVSDGSPKAVLLLVPVVKEAKSLVLPWAREV